MFSLITLLACLAGYLYLSPEPTNTQPQVLPLVKQEPAIAKQATEASLKKPQIKHQIDIIPESISESFSILAEAYATELTIPSYSVPITPEDTHLLNPNNYLPQQVPLQNGGSASIVLTKYRYSYPEPILVKLVVNGMVVTAAAASIKSELGLAENILAKADMLEEQGEWTVNLKAKEEWDEPVQISVTFDANGKKQTLSTGIEYSHPTATITGVGSVRAEGSDMVIPVKLTVEKAGHYRLRANLFTTNDQPIALLTHSKNLSEGDVTMELKAYKAVLSSHSTGFKLSSFVLELRPGVPGELTRYGHSKQPSFDLGDFAVEQLSDELWQPNEQEQQRLEFLQKMSGS